MLQTLRGGFRGVEVSEVKSGSLTEFHAESQWVLGELESQGPGQQCNKVGSPDKNTYKRLQGDASSLLVVFLRWQMQVVEVGQGCSHT